MKGLLSIVIPCYNEEKVLDIFCEKTLPIIKQLPYNYEMLFIDDGSSDRTAEIIKRYHEEDPCISLISFSRNFGKEAGIYAGLKHAKGDLVVVMDADLQHPPEIIPQMVAYAEEGYDTVATRRMNRKGEFFLKKFCANTFYHLMDKLTDTQVVKGVQDYRLMKRNVVEAILDLKEYNRFSKGIFSWVGFLVKYIEVDDVKRVDGKTKWNFKSLFNYAIEGILAFTTLPLRIATVLGIIISFGAFLFLLQIIIQAIFYGVDVPGYPSTMVVILFMGGIQMLLIGILSEYIAKIYYEIKARPKYIIREYIEAGSWEKENE